eukprot:TCALIF_08989-PA protein Name:"Similar to Robo1 Roundabout homolog 1 (Mus musculus)" AED:0.61 eAED:0.61 QI:0/0/0/0.5/1/1/2/0/159
MRAVRVGMSVPVKNCDRIWVKLKFSLKYTHPSVYFPGSNFPADAFLPTPPTPPPNAHSPPIILEHPTDLIVPENEPVTLTCHAAGTPRPMVQWFRAGTGKVETATQNAGSRRIQLPDGSLFFLGTKETVDAGKYWCEAFNANGIARSKNATLEIACEYP